MNEHFAEKAAISMLTECVDKQKLQETIENWPADTTINWSQIAREHGIPGKNAGQVATSHIATPKRKPTVRPRMKKLPGSEVFIPSIPPIGAVEDQIRLIVSSGRFNIGDECAPYTITKYTLVDNVMTPHDVQIQARKVPLKEIRQ